MALTECVNCGSKYLKTIKKQFDFKIEGGIPFRTKQKYERQQCETCGEEYVGESALKGIDTEVKEARAFIAEQDKLYSAHVNDGSIIPIKGYTVEFNSADHYPAKQWQRGVINYLRMVNTGEKVVIVPATSNYLIYCSEEDRLSIAAKQFVKPDDYFKLTSIQ